MAENNLLIDLEFPEEGPGKKLVQQTDRYSAFRICIKGGNTIPAHAGDHTALFTVIQGKCIFTLGKERTELAEGGYIYLPMDVERAIESVEDSVLLVIK